MVSHDTTIAELEARADWQRARQAANIEGILSLFGAPSRELIPFDEVQKRLRLSQRNFRGLQDIPLDQIRGSVGRYQDFTGTFLPRSEALRERWQRVGAVAISRGVPPVEVYQVGHAYFVVDGNHRVSFARQNGARSIQAYVWEFATPVGLSSEADLDEVFIKAEYADFLEKTHLDELRPEQNISFTTPGRYRLLLDQIAWYQEVIGHIDGTPCSWEDAVTAWYDILYTPAIQIIQQQGTLARFPGRTQADLFIWVWKYRQALQESGKSAHLATAAAGLPAEGIKGWLDRISHTVAGWLSPGKGNNRLI